MAAVNFEDITVHWGRAPDPMDQQTARWRQAVFQDLAISEDSRLLFYLYDPIADETSGTSGGRKGGPSIVIFDTTIRCFVREIPFNLRPEVEGVPKYMFMLDGMQSGRPSFILCTAVDNDYDDKKVNIYQFVLSPDGMNLAQQLSPIFGPVPVGDDWIITMREDVPEIVLLTGPGLTVWRINVRAPGAAPVDSFAVPDGDMTRYYDAFTWRGVVHLLASTPNENFDFSHVHLLDLAGRGPMRTMPTKADPQRGFPPNRKQTGMDLCQGRIFITGGENDNYGQVTRFNDVWWLDITDFTWQQVPTQLPLPLIEPRLTTAPNGVFHVWGDCDLASGCVAPPTHLHIIKVSGAPVEPPPSYHAASSPPAYGSTAPPPMGPPPGAPPPAGFAPPGGPPPGYPIGNQPPPGAPPSYPQQQPAAGGYPPASGYPQQGGYPAQGQGYPAQGQGGYPPQGQGYPAPGGYPQQGQHPVYPQQPQKSKDCVIS